MKKLLIFLYIILLSPVVFSQSGWIAQNSGTFENLNAIQFLDGNTGWVVGNAGVVLKTTNGGNNWVMINTGYTYNYYCLQIFSSSVIYVGTTNRKYLKSSDGGQTWSLMNSGVTPGPESITSLYFFDAQTGYVLFNPWICKTTNSGQNWYTDYMDGVLNFYFIPGMQNGYGVYIDGSSSSGFIKTTGNGWSRNSIVIGSSNVYNAVHFISTTVGTVAGNSGKIYKTSDGGNNWVALLSNTTKNLKAIISTNLLKNWAVGEQGTILNTTNGGSFWATQVSGTTNNLNSVYFAMTSTTGWISGDNGTILKTTNGGVGIMKISSEIPTSYKLYNNYPNPFNPSTNIKFQIKDSRFTTLKIYDILGKEIERLVNEKLSPGTYSIDWNATQYPSGIYFYRLQSENFTDVKRMMFVK
jgi:photosystem II stability/assembly factor-like uncharacterized protein